MIMSKERLRRETPWLIILNINHNKIKKREIVFVNGEKYDRNYYQPHQRLHESRLTILKIIKNDFKKQFSHQSNQGVKKVKINNW